MTIAEDLDLDFIKDWLYVEPHHPDFLNHIANVRKQLIESKGFKVTEISAKYDPLTPNRVLIDGKAYRVYE